MVWQIEFTAEAEKMFSKIGRDHQLRIRTYIRKQVSVLENPRTRGEPLKGNLTGLWRYRVGDYRVICRIIDDKITVVVIKVGHRREIYE